MKNSQAAKYTNFEGFELFNSAGASILKAGNTDHACTILEVGAFECVVGVTGMTYKEQRAGMKEAIYDLKFKMALMNCYFESRRK